jgi:N,N'-diacetyllegionaminate synthase
MQRTVIIAEAGVNHNGSIELAKKLIDVAKDAGADYVKFQTFKAENLVLESAKKTVYQQQNMSDADNSQYSMLKKLELSFEQHIELFEYCKKKQIKFFSTAFDLESIAVLSKLKLGIWKIPSGEITNYPYLKAIALKNEPVILSTGMSNLQEIKEAIDALTKNGLSKEKITVLHCNTEYPTPMQDVNLNAMLELSKELKVKTGYSDHTQGIEIPVAAAALGANVIEKHFTLDHNLEGPDHKASLEPEELKAMVKAIRNVENALGSEKKAVTPSEQMNKDLVRKSIVAACDIEEGELLTEMNLTTKRPGSGLSPMKWEKIINTKAIRSFKKNEFIEMQ